MGYPGSVPEPCGAGSQPELATERHSAQPVGWSGGVPSFTGKPAANVPLLRWSICMPFLGHWRDKATSHVHSQLLTEKGISEV